MPQIVLTYEQWKAVHPTFRCMIERVPHVAVYDNGNILLARVVLVRTARAITHPRPSAGQLRLRNASNSRSL